MTGTGVLGLEGMNDIYDVVIECTRLFESLMERKIPDLRGDTRDRGVVLRRRTEEMGRSFNLWVDYTGALAADVSRSLDTRLYDHGDIKEMVIELLQMLARNLEYLRGDDGTSPDVSCDDDLEEEATGAIQKALDELHFMATAIRRSSVRSQKYNLSSHFHRDDDSYFQQRAYLLVRYFFPDARRSLCDQLGESIAVRRKRIFQRIQREEKLSTRRQPAKPNNNLGKGVEGAERPLMSAQISMPQVDKRLANLSRQNPTVPRRGPAGPAGSADTGSRLDGVAARHYLKRGPALSTASTGSSIRLSTMTYPDKPRFVEGDERCACPYCARPLLTIRLENEPKYWQDHMDEDTKPYVCLSEECTSPLLFFVHMKQWIDHMKSFHSDQWNRKIHMSTWYCDIGHETALQFNDRNSFLRHMKDPASHDGRQPPTDLQLDTLSRNKHKILVREDEYCCPICDCVPNTLKPVIATSDPADIRKRLYEHIAAHIKDLAFKSVPALDNLELDQDVPSEVDDRERESLRRDKSAASYPSGFDQIKRETSLTFDENPDREIVGMEDEPYSKSYYDMENEATLWDNADFQEYWKSKITQAPKKSDTILEHFAQIQNAIRVGDLQGADRDNTHLGRSLPTTAPLHMDAIELFRIDSEITSLLDSMNDEDIRSFAELLEDLATDEQIELYIYTCFLTFIRMGLAEHLEQAIQRTEGWVAVTPSDHPDRARRFQILDAMSARRNQHTLAPSKIAAVIGNRFKRTGSIDDLNRAVNVASKVVDTTPQDHSDRASYLNSLGNLFGSLFQRTGSIDDLNLAVNIASMAVDTTLQGHPNRAIYLNNFGNWLGIRFERTGSIDDLNRAINVADQAVIATPEDHPNRADYLNSLGIWLSTRFGQKGSIDDLNLAINVADQAVNAIPEDHPNRASQLDSLGNWLSRRFEQTGSIDDLDRAINVADQAVNAIPEDHPNRASQLDSLGNWLGRRFEQTGSIDDLNRAINVAAQAVNATPEDYPSRAGWLDSLGNWLGRRYEQTRSIHDWDYRLSSYEEGWHCLTAPPSVRISLARKAAQIRALEHDWEGSSHLLQQAVETLPDVSPRWLKHTDKQDMLADFADLASAAAATALNAGKSAYNALQLLELGCSIIASLVIKTCGDISDLKQKYPNLAHEFISLRNELDSPGDKVLISSINMFSWESLSRRRRKAVQELDKLRSQIRAQPGFENFHLPPSINMLKAAACPDPIIIVNLSPYRCDAFIIERHQVRVLRLPNLTLEQVHQHAQDLRLPYRLATLPTLLLEWLWDVIARPVLDALGFQKPITDDTKWPHVWWVPTGLLSQLPLHAAGYHTNGSSETVLDRVMSSYASTVGALIYGRKLHFQEPARPVSDHALLVAMRETPNLPDNGNLPFTTDEVEIVKALCPSLQLRPIIPSLRKDNILQELQACRIFHFAGHGLSYPVEPSRSCLLLEDWITNPLMIGDLCNYKLQENPPFLGFLSTHSPLGTELGPSGNGINLVNAFQLAGFRHVVGTLWGVWDMHCVDVARVLYETLRDEGMTDVAVCRGLHRAVRALRDEEIKAQGTRNATSIGGMTEAQGTMNAHWISFVHFGV